MSTCDPKSCSTCPSKDSESKEVQLQCKLARIKHKVIVMSGKGGVGKSSVAVYLALGLAQQGYRVGLMDVDLHGPSVPKMLGLTGMLGVTREEEILPHSYGPNLKVVSIESLLEDTDSAVIWRGPLKHGVIQQFISQCKWDDLDFLVVDFPPGTLPNYSHKGLFVIGYEHNPAKISLDPLIYLFELIARNVMSINLGDRIDEKRTGLVHPEHQVVRCIGWELC